MSFSSYLRARYRGFVFLEFLILIITGSCTRSEPTNPATLNGNTPLDLSSSETQVTQELPTLRFTDEITSTASVATATLTPTQIIPTITPTIPRPTLAPQLSEDEAQIYLRELMVSNGNCKLPCFWGMIPGVSSKYEAANMVNQFNDLGNNPTFGSISIQPNIIITDSKVEPNTNYFESIFTTIIYDGAKVSKIEFSADAIRKKIVDNKVTLGAMAYDDAYLGAYAIRYELANVLTEMGAPDGVSISTTSDNLGRNGQLVGGFDLYLFYLEEDFFVHYTTQAHVANSMVKGCFKNAAVYMYIYPAGNPDKVKDYLRNTSMEGHWPVFESGFDHSIETAISMTPEEFYEKYKNPANDCIKTPTDIWIEADK